TSVWCVFFLTQTSRPHTLSVLALLIVITAAAAVTITAAEGERLNKTSSSGGLFWSTEKDEADLNRKAELSRDNSSSSSEGVVGGDHDDFDGGFSTLEGILQWAIGHSDPAKLKESAQDVQRLSSSELQRRQMEIKELMEKLRTPSDAELMKIAISDLNNSTLSLQDRQRALQELLVLVEPIDNANDLHKLGGLAALIQELNHPESEIRTLSAWVIGKASQNNAVVQKQVLELGALPKLMKMVRSTFAEEAIKALYAVSALIRNNLGGQEIFYADAGDMMLQNLLSDPGSDIRLRRKAVFLVSDLAGSQLENVERTEPPFFSSRLLLKSLVDLTAISDLDLQEKALVAIKNLLQLKTTEAIVFRDFCGLDSALERIRQQLQDLMVDEYQKDFAMDMETLCREVELIFLRKLGEVITVPT
ncbi:hypothetical protein Tsubulata_000235, partial [Turnera subulata]